MLGLAGASAVTATTQVLTSGHAVVPRPTSPLAHFTQTANAAGAAAHEKPFPYPSGFVRIVTVDKNGRDVKSKVIDAVAVETLAKEEAFVPVRTFSKNNRDIKPKFRNEVEATTIVKEGKGAGDENNAPEQDVPSPVQRYPGPVCVIL